MTLKSKHRHHQSTCFFSGFRRLSFIMLGIGSILWFLIRVIPKPNRASYPCMRVAAPLASSFVVYLTGVITSLYAFRLARRHLRKARYGIALLCVLAAVLTQFGMIGAEHQPTYSATLENIPNQPIGTPRGLIPGRVVWVHDPDATKETCIPTSHGHGWFLNENNDQIVIDKMVSTALREVSGQPDDLESWNAIFKFHNKKRGKGEAAYKSGEKILIKTNATSAWGTQNYNPVDLSVVQNSNYGISETSPQVVLAVLRQLVRRVGVAERDIYVGDPMRHIYKHCYDLWHTEFPDVNYLDHDYGAEKGRVKVIANTAPTLFYSDKGQVLGSAFKSDKLYQIFYEVEYLINLPTLKGHSYAGVTMFAKNHFGSHTRNDANHLHKGLVATQNRGVVTRGGYFLYRVQVDLMGHEALGTKNLLYLMDALWSSDFEIGPPVKWQMPPFNNDWMSSLFLSLDPVAIESVGYDFLKTEFTGMSGRFKYSQMDGTDDYLHQTASYSNWPAGLIYDPENDGTPIASLGVHEHWNNSLEKQYTRNLLTGNGIELYKVSDETGVAQPDLGPLAGPSCELFSNYPNPFNASTTIHYQIPVAAQVNLDILTITGQKTRSLVDANQSAGHHIVVWDGKTDKSTAAATGTYIYQLRTTMDGRLFERSGKMALVR